MIPLLCIVLLYCPAGSGFADLPETGVFRRDLGRIRQYERVLTAPAKDASSPVRCEDRATPSSVAPFLLRGGITVYQRALSSQDVPACNFVPSCSHYGQEAIRVHGALWGTLMTSDRLQRCIGTARRHYPLDPATLLGLDPVPPPHGGGGSQPSADRDRR